MPIPFVGIARYLMMISPIIPASHCVKYSRPFDIALMQRAPLAGVGMSYSPSMVPSGAMRAILLAKFSVDQRSPSGPTQTPRNEAFGVGHRMLGDVAGAVDAAERVGRGLDEPDAAIGMRDRRARLAVVARNLEFGDLALHIDAADLLPAASLNHSAPSRSENDSGFEPGVMPSLNSVTLPSGVMRPIWLTSVSENQTLPSGPSRMPSGPAFAVGSGNSVTLPLRSDAADLMGALLAEPVVAVAADADADRRGVRGRQLELGEARTLRIEPADLGGAAFAEPQAAVEAFHRDVGLAARGRDFVLADFGCFDRAGAGRLDQI